MAKHVILATAVLLAGAAAQVTIYPADIPRTIGDSFLFKYATEMSPVNVGQPGGPHTWNFDTSTIIGELTSVTIVPLSSTPFEQQFPTANIVTRDHPHSGDENHYVFQTLGTTSCIQLGMGIVSPETSVCVVYNPAQTLFPLPLRYQDQWRWEYGFSLLTPPIRSVVRYWGTPRVDAWGTVITPEGSHSCLRINCYETTATAIYMNDTLLVADTFGHRVYAWCAPRRGFVVSATGPEDDTSLNFTQSDCYRVMVASQCAVAEEPQRTLPRPAVTVLPNPCVNKALFVLTDPEHRLTELELCDRDGRLVCRLKGDKGRFVWDRTDGSGRPVPAGIYFCSAGAGAPAKLIVAD